MRDARLMALDLGFPRLQARSNTLTLSRESRLDSFISTIEDKKTWSNEGLGQSLIGTRRQGLGQSLGAFQKSFWAVLSPVLSTL